MPGTTTSWKLFISSWNASSFTPGTATVGNRPSDATDITDRLLGAEVDMSIGIGDVPQAIGTFVLDNNDGAYTPTSSSPTPEQSYTWFRQPVFLVPVMNGSEVNPTTGAGWFSGFCTDVQFEDDGFNSTLTLTVVDWFTFASRYTFTQANLDAVAALRAGGRPFSTVPNFVWEYVLSAVPSPNVASDVLDLNVSSYA